MSRTKRFKQLAKKLTKKFLNHPNRWALSTRENCCRKFVSPGTDYEIRSPFGVIRSAVVTDEKGDPHFDRPAYYEPPFPHCLVWGYDQQSEKVHFVILHQARPHSNNTPSCIEGQIMEPEEEHPAVVFAQLVQGYAKNGELLVEAAKREVTEELNIPPEAVLEITSPPAPFYNFHPGFVATWGTVFYVQVDLGAVRKALTEKPNSTQQEEQIKEVVVLSAAELIQRIKTGYSFDGKVVYRWPTQNGILMQFFCQFPHLWPSV
ncbi:NUDIX domain-containing protein [Patescibacteria group bacterium]|nr:NUDIX domain-containing protein [Patescibacteria group bacterium]